MIGRKRKWVKCQVAREGKFNQRPECIEGVGKPSKWHRTQAVGTAGVKGEFVVREEGCGDQHKEKSAEGRALWWWVSVWAAH